MEVCVKWGRTKSNTQVVAHAKAIEPRIDVGIKNVGKIQDPDEPGKLVPLISIEIPESLELLITQGHRRNEAFTQLLTFRRTGK